MKLSIITINYNNRIGLLKTIESIRSQSFIEFEWIIIDGGSTDGSKDLIEENHQLLAFWCSERDNGIYNAMNKGIARATGEYIHFLNSGDTLYSSDVYRQILPRLEGEDIVYGNISKKDHGKIMIDRGFHSNHITCYQMISGTIFHPAAFIKKELFSSVGKYDENLKIVSDWKFFFEAIVLHKSSVKYVNITVANFDTEGISSSNKEKNKEERKNVIESLLPPYVIEDYESSIHLDNIQSYHWSRYILMALHKVVTLYEVLFINKF